MATIEEMTIKEYKEMVERLQQECKEKSDLILALGKSIGQLKEAPEPSNSIEWYFPSNYQGELRGVVLKIKKVKDNAEIPRYQTEGSSGMDLCAATDNTIIIPPLQRVFISTGIAIELPLGYEAQVRPRSGLSSKHGITLVNCVGTIDSDYRGEIIVPLINLSDSAYSIQPGERIAQMIISKYERVGIKEVSELSPSGRGTGGFGSTGSM
jgi:dUTP pyrophosphatase